MTARRSILGLVAKIGVSLLAAGLVLIVADRVVMKTKPDLALSRFDDARGYQIFTSRCEVCHAKDEGDLGIHDRGGWPRLWWADLREWHEGKRCPAADESMS